MAGKMDSLYNDIKPLITKAANPQIRKAEFNSDLTKHFIIKLFPLNFFWPID